MSSFLKVYEINEKNDGEKMQKAKEVRVKMYREHQEEERLKKLKDIEQQFMMSKKHREQLEEMRRRKIEEARLKETERRIQVEERKRQIWEAEQERKEAILRRNMEREARIEARRNAQRNQQSFAFGSSTPRTFDFDLAAIGSQGPVLMSSISNRRSEEREPSRATSACSLDRKFGGEDYMSRSMISLSTFRGRKRTDITPTLSRERSITPHLATRGKQNMRAVSMTRLDQLAQPRQPQYRCHPPTTPIANNSSDMSRSMCNLAAKKPAKLPDIKSNMRPAQSMMHLAPPKMTRAAKLRALSSTKSAWNLNSISPGKDSSQSPTRPQSSLSGTSDISATSSSVSLRAHSAYRKPRPVSVAGSIADSRVHLMVKKDLERQSQLLDRNATVHKKTENSDVRKKKPVPPPKSSAVLAKAKSYPVPPPPTKDNLRKTQKISTAEISGDNKNLIIPPLSKNISQNKSSIEPETKVKSASIVDTNVSLNSNKVNGTIKHSGSDSEENSNNSQQVKVLAETNLNEISPQTANEMQIKSKSVDNEVDPKSKETMALPLESKIQMEISNGKVDPNSKETVTSPLESNTQMENNTGKVDQKSKETLTSPVESKTQVENNTGKDTKSRIVSEEEARIALAEKRRLAREQAEREAELERLRLEDLKRKEEERKRLELEEQKRVEEEQIRLAAIYRQLEEEKLRKAIEEQQQREMEQQKQREEEMRQKAEREELEKKAREEAEKQRIELEEKLRKEEEERAERKKRVEQIMARTRNKMAASTNDALKSVPKEDKSATMSRSMGEEQQIVNYAFKHEKDSFPDLLNIESISNGTNEEKQLCSLSNTNLPIQSNGHHENMSCTASPEEKSDADGLLIDIQSCDLVNSSEFTKTAEPHHLNNSVNNDNFLINVDDFNSNLIDSGGSFDNTIQRNASAVPDLLS